ncbi:DUF4192 domain-containing protein [Nocardioides sp. SYSU DS0651]|uniref:DUF4192 domain-containing protein n=1 Tax=Nocardioides sp. SYSU DS0651 TaxID=3415955 RepID=UPI003F4BF6A0
MTTPHPTSAPSDPDGLHGPTTLTARTPEDLLALAPVLLGFWPEESIVMLTFGAGRPFHARLDIPPLPAQSPVVLHDVAEALLEPARDHRVRRLVLLYFTADAEAAAGVHRALRRGCRRAGMRLVTALHADGETFAELTRSAPEERTPYDVGCHPFVVEAMVAGRIRHRTRDDLVASLEADPEAVAAVCAALAADRGPAAVLPTGAAAVLQAGRWVESLVRWRVATGGAPTDAEVARLVWSTQVGKVRDAALSLVGAGNAEGHVRFWADVVRRTPEALVAAPAGLLGWSAWQAGDGALAWAAVDRCRRSDPEHALARSLATLLQHAVPPDRWGRFDWSAGL